jgi:acyl-coenzyme A thioesterase 13
MSFIATAKEFGLSAITGPFVHENRFDSCLRGLVVETLVDGSGEVEATILVDEHLTNSYSTLHGGAISTIVDVAGTLALLTKDPQRAGVSVEMNTSFLAAAKKGDTLRVRGRVLKYGKRMGFTEIEISQAEDDRLVAVGRHTKAF